MNNDVITDVSQINIDWLNSVLIGTTACREDKIKDFEIEASGSDNASIVKIQLNYTSEAGALPKSVLLKICSGNNSFTSTSEVNYYTQDYIDLANRPIPICYNAAYKDNPPQYHILMEDLSRTHRPNWNVKPTLKSGCAVAQALAKLHAHYWRVEKLEAIGAYIPNEANIGRYVTHARPGLLPMLKETGNKVDDSWLAELSEVFEHHPKKMLERTRNTSGFTLIHGDTNPGNILSPLNGDGKVYLIDRQPFDWSLITWLGVSDIAYMMVHWWDTNVRRELEYSILRAYHETLQSLGVSNYDWEQLISDYKLAAVQSLYVACEWCVKEEDRRKMKWVWLPQLQKSMAAFFDLSCSELWTVS